MHYQKAKFIAPMLLLRTEELPEDPEWSVELKLDSYRSLVIKSGGNRKRHRNNFAKIEKLSISCCDILRLLSEHLIALTGRDRMLGTVFFFGVLAGVDKLQACSAIGLLPIRSLSNLVNGRRIVVGMPLALSFDNLLAGAGISSLHYPVVISAPTIGLVSALMSCIGLYLGASIRRFVPGRMEFAVGAYLCVLAGRSLSMGGA
jgi:hypothetical protein